MNITAPKQEELSSTTKQPDTTLGINNEIFHDAMQSGLIYYKNVNKFHPVTAGGSRAWEEIVAIFRQNVVDQHEDWKQVQQHGMPILINSKLGYTIVITSGDENTGKIGDCLPKTRNAKGEVTQNFVGKNYDLFDDTPIIELHSSIDDHQTWVLLYTIDKHKSEIRYELSLPTNTALSGNKGRIKICDWSDRNIFPSIPFESTSQPTSPEFSDESNFFDVVKK